MTDPVYYDMPGKIHLENGVAIIDMYERIQVGDHAPSKEPDYLYSERVVLPIPALVELYKMMSKTMGKLEADRLLHTRIHLGRPSFD